ncbi:MAG TPA: IclR family transcriptional regulator [Plantibacter sp.]|uniref:IclR family transcriptional regulator n=1 Tax=unclassified Plantibacter TaxID=2624265 RepID=UPI002D1012A2|nr:IclR family transcriptional regulator [Plantibacter sp.]
MVDGDERVVGAARVLAVLTALAQYPTGVSLDDLTGRLGGSKSTVHRALASLRSAGLADQVSRGVYVLGDEFLRLAFLNAAQRPAAARVEPILRSLAERYGETAHFAVLDGTEVVYRAKVDPPGGAVRLTSEIGGRNPAYCTGVGKLLLAFEMSTKEELRQRLGDVELVGRTDRTITSIDVLWDELATIRGRGWAVDDQENEVGVNCIALPFRLDPALPAMGAISVSALAFRMPLDRLIAEEQEIRSFIEIRSQGAVDDQ